MRCSVKKHRWCSQDRNHQDQDMVKTLRLRLHQKLWEIWDWDFKICAFCQNYFSICHHHFWLKFFSNFCNFYDIFWLFITCKYNNQKNHWIIEILLNHFFAILKVSKPVAFKTKTRPETFKIETRKMGLETNLESETTSWHSITEKHYLKIMVIEQLWYRKSYFTGYTHINDTDCRHAHKVHTASLWVDCYWLTIAFINAGFALESNINKTSRGRSSNKTSKLL